jgi:hypothetical protein
MMRATSLGGAKFNHAGTRSISEWGTVSKGDDRFNAVEIWGG